VNSLPKTVTGQRRDCDLNPGPSAPESSTLTISATEPPVTVRNKRICYVMLWRFIPFLAPPPTLLCAKRSAGGEDLCFAVVS